MSPRPRRSLLREEATDARLGLRVFALADVAVTNDASPVDEDQRRPPAHGVAVPDGEVVVLHDGVLDPELAHGVHDLVERLLPAELRAVHADDGEAVRQGRGRDRKSTRLNSSHVSISYAVFCLKKKRRTRTSND